MAIVTIHAEARYYEGLDLLCELVGWKSFRCEGLYPEEQMNAWVRSKGGGTGLKAAPAVNPAPPDPGNAIEILQGALGAADSPRKKRGWPKGKPRGPRRSPAEVIPMTRTTVR